MELTSGTLLLGSGIFLFFLAVIFHIRFIVWLKKEKKAIQEYIQANY